MGELTSQMEKFCQGVASGMSQADAYRAAYPKSLKWKPETLHPQASKMMADNKIITRVTELKDEIAAKALWTREDSVLTLKSVIDASDKGMEITGAVKVLNEMHGYNAPKEINVTGNLNINVNFD